MIYHGKIQDSYFHFDPEFQGYRVVCVEMKKGRDAQGREVRKPQWIDITGWKVFEAASLQVTFDKKQTLVDFSTFRRSDKEPTRVVEYDAGNYEFTVLSVTLPESVREGPFEIVVLPGTFMGLALIGLETLLEKEKRVRESVQETAPKYVLFNNGVSHEHVHAESLPAVALGSAPSS
jgi:hypothetical protein